MDSYAEAEERERQRELRRIARIVRKDWMRIEQEAEFRNCGKSNVGGYAETMATAVVLATAEEWEGDEADFVRGIVSDHEEYIAKKKSLERVGMKINRFWQDWGNLCMARAGKSVVQLPGFEKWLEGLDELAVEGKDVLRAVGD